MGINLHVDVKLKLYRLLSSFVLFSQYFSLNSKMPGPAKCLSTFYHITGHVLPQQQLPNPIQPPAAQSIQLQQQQQQQQSTMSPIERILLALERATPHQQELLFQKIRATPETRQQLLSKVHELRMFRQQRQQQQQHQSQQHTSFQNPAPPLRMMSTAGKSSEPLKATTNT